MRMGSIKWWIGGILLVSAVVLALALQKEARQAFREWDPNRARKAGKPIPVRTVKVTESEVEEMIGGTAITAPSETATIIVTQSTSTVPGREVSAVHAWEGSEVKHGDVLVEFRRDLFEAIVNEREAVLKAAEAELESMAKLRSQQAVSVAEHRVAELKVVSAKLELGMARNDLEQCKIDSPINGVLSKMDLVEGTHVTGTAQITEVHNLNPIFVRMDFPLERIDVARVGQQAEVVFDSLPEQKFTATLKRISPLATVKARVLPVTLTIDNPGNRLKSGLTGYVRIRVSKTAKTIPATAVIQRRNRAMAFCVEDSRAKIKEISTGPGVNQGLVEIISGLEKGDEVVMYGQDSLRENDMVNVDWKQWTNRGSERR